MPYRPLREVWAADFEFAAPAGENPRPICLVAQELISGRLIRLSERELAAATVPPYDIGPDSLFVAYYASAEIGCHLALGWPVPANVLDLYVEFRNFTNGLELPCGRGLLGALTYFGFDGLAADEKSDMRELALRGGPFTAEEMAALLDYCQTDADALAKLYPVMLPRIDMPRALLRGKYMAAAAHIERNGVPIDMPTFIRLRDDWEYIKSDLILAVNKDFGTFEGQTFKLELFERLLITREIPWPRLPSGQLDLSRDTFREMSRAYPLIAPIYEVRENLSQLRLNDLAVGADCRNRTMLSAFASRTGRNQPSNAKFIFGPSVWLRSLIKPEPGTALAYCDWSQQEFAVAAALSGDQAMQAAYLSGDPYLEFAKQAGAIPKDAHKGTWREARERFKACALAVQYGMEAESLAQRIGQSPAHARELLRLHRETYRHFWQWSDAALDHAMLYGQLKTTFGWTVRPGPKPNPRSLRNFPMQANGAEMLRLVCIMGVEAGIKICAPIHDAVLIEAPAAEIEDHVRTMQRLMEDASAVVLDGFKLRSDAKIVRYPDRYSDPRGLAMWETVMGLINQPGQRVAA